MFARIADPREPTGHHGIAIGGGHQIRAHPQMPRAHAALRDGRDRGEHDWLLRREGTWLRAKPSPQVVERACRENRGRRPVPVPRRRPVE